MSKDDKAYKNYDTEFVRYPLGSAFHVPTSAKIFFTGKSIFYTKSYFVHPAFAVFLAVEAGFFKVGFGAAEKWQNVGARETNSTAGETGFLLRNAASLRRTKAKSCNYRW